jgi:hypothetical protein
MKDKTITVIKFDAGRFGAGCWHVPRMCSHIEPSRLKPEQKRGKPA